MKANYLNAFFNKNLRFLWISLYILIVIRSDAIIQRYFSIQMV